MEPINVEIHDIRNPREKSKIVLYNIIIKVKTRKLYPGLNIENEINEDNKVYNNEIEELI